MVTGILLKICIMRKICNTCNTLWDNMTNWSSIYNKFTTYTYSWFSLFFSRCWTRPLIYLNNNRVNNLPLFFVCFGFWRWLLHGLSLFQWFAIKSRWLADIFYRRWCDSPSDNYSILHLEQEEKTSQHEWSHKHVLTRDWHSASGRNFYIAPISASGLRSSYPSSDRITANVRIG